MDGLPRLVDTGRQIEELAKTATEGNSKPQRTILSLILKEDDSSSIPLYNDETIKSLTAILYRHCPALRLGWAQCVGDERVRLEPLHFLLNVAVSDKLNTERIVFLRFLS